MPQILHDQNTEKTKTKTEDLCTFRKCEQKKKKASNCDFAAFIKITAGSQTKMCNLASDESK